MTSPSTPAAVLALPMRPNDADAATVRDYLVALLAALWEESDNFSGKRPFGNSSWPYDLYETLGKAGLVEVIWDEDGYIRMFGPGQQQFADRLIADAIKHLGVST